MFSSINNLTSSKRSKRLADFNKFRISPFHATRGIHLEDFPQR